MVGRKWYLPGESIPSHVVGTSVGHECHLPGESMATRDVGNCRGRKWYLPGESIHTRDVGTSVGCGCHLPGESMVTPTVSSVFENTRKVVRALGRERGNHIAIITIIRVGLDFK
jgi:hypothetical protein